MMHLVTQRNDFGRILSIQCSNPESAEPEGRTYIPEVDCIECLTLRLNEVSVQRAVLGQIRDDILARLDTVTTKRKTPG